jgi:hypothetical protein
MKFSLLHVLIASIALVFSGCDEEQRAHYRTIADARNDGAIERGWLPASLPESAFDITEAHDLDTNTGDGTFGFAAPDTAAFKARLRPLPSDYRFRRISIDRGRHERDGFVFYAFEDFYIAVNWTTHEVRFWLDYIDRNAATNTFNIEVRQPDVSNRLRLGS